MCCIDCSTTLHHFDVLKNFPVTFQDEATVHVFGEYAISYAHPVIKYVSDFCVVILLFLETNMPVL